MVKSFIKHMLKQHTTRLLVTNVVAARANQSLHPKKKKEGRKHLPPRIPLARQGKLTKFASAVVVAPNPLLLLAVSSTSTPNTARTDEGRNLRQGNAGGTRSPGRGW